MKKRVFAFALGLSLLLCAALAGCNTDTEPSRRLVTIRIKCPPMTMAYDADHPDVEVYDLFHFLKIFCWKPICITMESWDISG